MGKSFYEFDEELDESMGCGGCDKLATHLVSHQTYKTDDSVTCHGTFTAVWVCEEHIEQAVEELVTDCGAPNEDSVRIMVETIEDIEIG